MSAEPQLNVVELQPRDETPLAKTERQLYELIEVSAALVGGKDIAAKLMEFDKGDWRRTFDRNGRYLAVEHVMRLNARLLENEHQVAAMHIGAPLTRPADALVMPRVQMTQAEQNRRARQMMDAMSAAAGVDLWSKAMETP